MEESHNDIRDAYGPNDHDHIGECPKLWDIQVAYLVGINQHLGPLLDRVEEGNWSACQQIAESLREWLPNFWLTNILCLEDHLKALPGLKMVYGLDSHHMLCKSGTENTNVVSDVGLYVDTVILTDPVYAQVQLMEGVAPVSSLDLRQWIGMLVQSMAAILKYREVILADLSQPICVVVPDYFRQTPVTYQLVCTMAQQDVVGLFSKLTGKRIGNFDKLQRILRKVKTLEDFDRIIVDKSLWRTVTNASAVNPSDPIKEWDSGMNAFSTDSVAQWAKTPVGVRAGFRVSAHYTQINELTYRSWVLKAHPLMTREDYWNLLVLKNELRLNPHIPALTPDVFITRAIASSESDRVKAITGLPFDDLITLRKEGALQDLRDQLFGNLTDLDATDPQYRPKLIAEVTYNLDELMRRHSEELDKLAAKELKFFGITALPFICRVALALSVPLSHDPVVQTAGALAGLTGVGSVKDLVSGWKSIFSDGQAIHNSPASMLFRRLTGSRNSTTQA